jgi:hypothetical protein
LATFYVAESPTGVDSRSAAQAQNAATPWATTAKALNDAAVVAGSVVEIRSTGGVLTDNFFVNGRNSITIQNYPGEDVIVQNAQTATWVWAFENCNGMVVRVNPLGGSLTFRHTPPAPVIPSAGVAPGGKSIRIMGVLIDTASANPLGVAYTSQPGVTFDGIVISEVRGICIYGHMSGVIVRNCDLSHGSIGVLVDGTSAASGASPRPCNGILVEDNDIHDLDKLYQDARVAGEGDDTGASGVTINRVFNSGTPPIIRRNRFWNNTTYSSVYTRDGEGFTPFRSGPWEVYENEFWDNEAVMETGTAAGPVEDPNRYYDLPGGNFHHNYVHGDLNTNALGPAILIRSNDNNQFHHNTFVMDGGGRYNGFPTGNDPGVIVAIWSGGGFGDIQVQNLDIHDNIIINTLANASPGNQIFQIVGNQTISNFDYNLYYSPFGANPLCIDLNGAAYTLSAAGLTSFRAGSVFGDHDVWAQNPLLNADGTLQSGSPAIGAGTGGADIGAYDFTAGGPTVYAADDFSTPVTDGWGTADTGGAWTLVSGTAANMDVAGGKALMTLPSGSSSMQQGLNSVAARDADVLVLVDADKLPTGSTATNFAIFGRRIDASNYTKMLFSIVHTTGAINVRLLKVVAGSATFDTDTSTGLTYVAADRYWIRYRMQDDGTTLTTSVKTWLNGTSETVDFQKTFAMTDSVLLAAGTVHLRMETGTISNLPIVFAWDDLTVTSVNPSVARGSVDAVTVAQTGARLFAGLRPVAGSIGFGDSAARAIIGGIKSTSDAVTFSEAASSAGKNLGRYPVTNRS